MVELERSLADEGMLAATADGAALLSDAVTSERFPHVHRLYALESRSPAADAAVPVLEGATLEVDDEFMLGVDLLLDGLEKRRSRSRQARGGEAQLADRPSSASSLRLLSAGVARSAISDSSRVRARRVS